MLTKEVLLFSVTFFFQAGFVLVSSARCCPDPSGLSMLIAKSAEYFFTKLSTIECFDKATKNKVWTVKIRGYIYTDIEKKNNCLIFGTAGKGGAFYCIKLNTGQVLTEYINNDSSNYEWQSDSVILKDKKGNMQQLNPFTGAVLKTLILKDKMFYAPILADKQYIYTTTYNKKTNSGRLICVRNDTMS